MTNKRITSIEIHMYSSGFSSPEEIQAEKVIVYRSGRIKHKLFNGLSEIAIQEFEYNMSKLMLKTSLYFLFQKLKLKNGSRIIQWKYAMGGTGISKYVIQTIKLSIYLVQLKPLLTQND